MLWKFRGTTILIVDDDLIALNTKNNSAWHEVSVRSVAIYLRLTIDIHWRIILEE